MPRSRLLLVLLAGLATCRSESPRRPSFTGPTNTVQALDADVLRGFCYAHTYSRRGRTGYGSDSSMAAKRALLPLNVKWLSLTPFGFVPQQDSSKVMLISDLMQQARAKKYFEENEAQAETDEVVRAEIAQARELGFKIQLKPHLWMLDQTWRGQLNPKTPEAWTEFWANYRRFILHYADLAQSTNVEMLVIGVELDQTVVDHADQWRRIIRDVRARYQGKIVYAANWDAFDRTPFWSELDYIGVQFYPPLAESPGEDISAMRRRLDAALDAVGETAKKVSKPVLLTEVGYRAVRGTAVHPHEWPDPNAREVDVEAQARAYEVLLTGLKQRPFVKGIFLWKWYTNEEGDEGPAGFSPRDKPAAGLIRQAFAAAK